MIEIAYKTNEGMKIVTYQGRVNMMQSINPELVYFTLNDGSQLIVSVRNIYYYRIINNF